jgi:hypothetical protein
MCGGRQGGVAVCAACWRTVKGRAEPVKGESGSDAAQPWRPIGGYDAHVVKPSLSLVRAAGGNKAFDRSHRDTELPAASVGNQ